MYDSTEGPQNGNQIYTLDIAKVAVIGFIIILVLAGLLLPPIKLASRIFSSSDLTAISDSNPVVTHAGGLAISTELADGSLQVGLSTISSADFYNRTAGTIWNDALDKLPATLQLVSPIFQIDSEGIPSSQILLDLRLPASGYRLETVDLFAWDAEQGKWIFIPSSFNLATSTLQATPNALPSSIAAFNTQPVPPILAITQEPGQTLSSDLSASIDILLAAGLQTNADGSITGTMASGATGSFATIPVIRNFTDPAQINTNTLLSILADVSIQQTHLDALVQLASTPGNTGIALDYRQLQPEQEPAYTAFVAALASMLHDIDRQLIIILPSPVPDANFALWDTSGYNWQALGASADLIQISPGLKPTDYAANGLGGRMMLWATDQINRYKLLLGTSTFSVAVTNNQARTVPHTFTIDPLTPTVDPLPPQDEENTAYLPGDALTFALGDDDVSNFGIDPTTGIYRYDLLSQGQLNQLWMVTPSKVRERLALATVYNIAGVMAYDLLSPDNIPAMQDALIGYKIGAPTAAQNEFQIEWLIKDADDTIVTSATIPFGQTFTWETVEDLQGDFTAAASLFSTGKDERGSLEIAFATPEPEPAPAPAAVVSSSPGVAAAVSTASGNFELGGQSHTLANPGAMQSAGMSWVKFQQKWSPGSSGFEVQGRVDLGHSNGFKVLFSIPGPANPSSIDFGAYTNYLSEVAQTGVDGIEIWNEMNLSREWPANDISGTSYVNNMLAPGFNAIKAVNPGILVISGAPAPTGAFGGCGDVGFVSGCDDWFYNQQMAAAGAANFMDCMGVHFNSGATSPTVQSGHPADGGDGHYSWYFQGMVNAYGVIGKPLCFTEIGFLSDDGYASVSGGNFNWGANTTVAQQAQWLGEAVSLARGFARLLIVWNVDIFTYEPSDPQGGYAIIRPDGTCPACGVLGSS